MSKKALIIIDYTVDFVASNGALTCGEPGQLIEEKLISISNTFIEQGHLTIFAVDTHYENDPLHPETKLFPAHNIVGTEGRELYGGLSELYKQSEQLPHVNWMDKTRYSSFVGTDLELKLRANGVTQLHLVGVCTDICVLHTAIDAYNKGFEIVIYDNAVASFDSDGHAWALRHFKNSLGASIKTI
ncbi:cysteine hydrolase family protein [Alkalihalobacillus trypoxylicola]|uniref:Isochorismatase n=1 Tax=Alkalihalobacillus trypoxylicola TaxID=519424 RepID=A0A161PL95_9BACI|nr:isochorismatase [Alkalihalobacillus trypoxylicola]